MKNIKEENEITYQIESAKLIPVLMEMLSNWKSFKCNEGLFVLEKGKKTSELHFLFSDDFRVTRVNNGSRFRVKYDLSNKNWKYTEKFFIDGKRYEQNYVCKREELEEKMGEISYFDAIMLKHSVKYDYVDFHLNKRFRISFDCCNAISTENPQLISENFCYIEIESKQDTDISCLYQTDFFNFLKPYLIDMCFDSHNRIRMCHKYFGNREIKREHIFEYFRHLNKCLDFEKYDIFLTCNYLNLRGEKSKERDETIEYELKLLGVENPNEILTRIKKFLPENMKLVKAEPRIITDIYFDTENLSLLNNNASFRLRRQKKSGGWIACFKKPNDMGIVLSRNKFQTTLRASDIHSYDTSPLSGIAYCKAQEFLKKYNDGNLLKPYILVIEYRDRYVLRIGETKTDSSREEKHYDMKRREFMHIIFDFVSVYDLTKMNNDEFLHLIDYGELDYTNKVLKFKTFYTTEIEPNTRKDVKSLSMKIFGQICEVVKELGEITNLSKYALGMDVVGNE